MWILGLIILGVLIYLVWRTASGKGFASSTTETPLEVIKKRYAKGEITKEQYEQMKKDLEN